MLVENWMTTKVHTVAADATLMEASKTLKDYAIRRLPVVDSHGRLLGIVTDRDIKEASPSRATTLDIHELYYLLSAISLQDIMTPSPVTVRARDTVGRAAILMRRHTIEGLPVVDDDNTVVGIITESDIFDVLTTITGARQPGIQFGVTLPTTTGSLQAVLDLLREHGARVTSLLTAADPATPETRQVYIRIALLPLKEQTVLRETLGRKTALSFWVEDDLPPAPKEP